MRRESEINERREGREERVRKRRESDNDGNKRRQIKMKQRESNIEREGNLCWTK